MNGGEIGDAIRRDVFARIAHFVEQLLFDRCDGDAPAGARVLGEAERPVGLGFDDRIADVGQIRNRFPIHLAISAGPLRAAFDGVPGDGAGREPVPIVGLPPEFVNHRREREAGIGHAAGDDDLRALRERVDHGQRAEVNVRALHVARESAASGSPVSMFFSSMPRARNASSRSMMSSPATVATFIGIPWRLATSSTASRHAVGFTPPALAITRMRRCLQIRKHAGDHVDEIASIAGLGIARPLLLQDRHGDLGQIIERQVIDRAAPHLLHRALRANRPRSLVHSRFESYLIGAIRAMQLLSYL